VTAQLLPPVPPRDTSANEYALFTVAVVKLAEVVTTASGTTAAAITIESDFVTTAAAASVATTEKLKVPATVGVPPITPVAKLSESPPGKLPVTLQVTGLRPPLEVTDAL
jgi:hypothetical protein